ncbi:MAG TPA: hypothetical protein PKN18_01135 [Pseudomonadales bacterium]|nr:hypothetical protein [Pseudomonadales bacterium]
MHHLEITPWMAAKITERIVMAGLDDAPLGFIEHHGNGRRNRRRRRSHVNDLAELNCWSSALKQKSAPRKNRRRSAIKPAAG